MADTQQGRDRAASCCATAEPRRGPADGRGADDGDDALRRRGRLARGARRRDPRGRSRSSSKRELEMAKQLIDSLSAEFDPDKYRDEYREELLALIERKAEGRGGRLAGLRGAEADQGARPDGGAGGEPGRGQGRHSRGEPLGAKGKAEAKPRQEEVRQDHQEADREARPKPRSRGRRAPVALTNLDKVLWPKAGFTKGRGDRLLRPDRRHDPPPPARPAADAGAVSRRRRVAAVLREAGAPAHRPTGCRRRRSRWARQG